MKVLLVGSGGREHALGWALNRSGRVKELISLPGNPGLAGIGSIVEGVAPTDVGAVAALARIQQVDLVVVGPEAPLAAGVIDALTNLGIPAFGPTRAAARLESSKSFAKDVLNRAGVATAGAWTFTEAAPARDHIDTRPGPYVVKADGLAAGKGVLVTESRQEAHAWVDRCLGGGFGDAGATVMIEEYLDGPEVSVFAVCSGEKAVALAPARDYKLLSDGDKGPNTGGMGAYSPVNDLPPDLVESTMTEVVTPVLRRMAEDGHPYTGFLYVGLILTPGGPKVLEFNARLGDPETQVVLPRLDSQLLDLVESALSGHPAEPTWKDEAAVGVVLAAAGYPENPVKGTRIGGLDLLDDDVWVFHAGTSRQKGGLVTDGGRVLSLVSLGESVAAARNRVYKAAEVVSWKGMQYRRDIAFGA